MVIMRMKMMSIGVMLRRRILVFGVLVILLY
jgi:hypothetical protein